MLSEFKKNHIELIPFSKIEFIINNIPCKSVARLEGITCIYMIYYTKRLLIVADLVERLDYEICICFLMID